MDGGGGGVCVDPGADRGNGGVCVDLRLDGGSGGVSTYLRMDGAGGGDDLRVDGGVGLKGLLDQLSSSSSSLDKITRLEMYNIQAQSMS